MENKGIILAAGYSSRMGDFKPLLPVGEMSALERTVRAYIDGGIRHIVVVTGYGRNEILQELHSIKYKLIDMDITLQEAYNGLFHKGMFTSIQAGVQKVFPEGGGETDEHSQGKEADGVFLTPVDCPMIPSGIFQTMMQVAHDNRDSFVVPCYKEKKGHPLWIPVQYVDEILSYEGDDGLKGIMSHYQDKLIRINTDCEGVVLDMDTKESYEEILEYLKITEEGENANEGITFKGRVFLIRHGETERHREKVFLGQTDVELSNEGRHQALNAGLEIADYKANTDRIYTSSLKRAVDTAKIISTAVDIAAYGKQLEVKEEPAFMEMHLGDWEGKYIREIKEAFPEEYERRGKELLKYKVGNDAENYYDLQYRVMKRLYKILYEEAQIEAETGQNRDVIIVAHIGVIRVILANLMGRTLEEALEIQIPKGAMAMIETGN